MTWWQAHSWADWVQIWESQSEEWLRKWRWELYDLHDDSAAGPDAQKFVKRALSEIARIERRRALHWLLREQLLKRPDLSGDILVDALIDIERMRLDLDLEGPGSFEDAFKGALEVAETRAETFRKEQA